MNPFLEGRATPTPALPRSEKARTGEGAEQPLPINNRVVLHLLEALQVLQVKAAGGGGPAEARRLSFRALDIEQIGTVYQGLLDHTAVRATEPVLGFIGTKDREPEIALSALEANRAAGGNALIEFLIEQTGRSEAALRRGMMQEAGGKIQEAGSASRTLALAGSARVVHLASQLQAACGNDAALLARVLPFANLIRPDDFEQPLIILPGSVYVTAGLTRRQTQTHYTPRSLTEPIVQRTLEPLVYIGPAEGLPRAQWRLRRPAEILALKICDMAVGSASFHVQADRYLAELLVEAWDALTPGPSPKQSEGRFTVEGEPASQNPTSDVEQQLVPGDANDRLILARRLIAERCLYGVDKNPMAVEIAKLSMWLVTMAKDRPFTFLDHAFKCGDSLVGADEEMFQRWAHGLQDAREMTLFDETLRDELDRARSKRRELESFVVNEPRDAERKAALLAEAEAAMARVKLGCDLIIGTRLLNVKPKEKEARLNTLLIEFMAQTALTSPMAQEAIETARKVRAFHWPFEFPEVFIHEEHEAARSGFDAFVGNPPFLGGKRISTMHGDGYLEYVRWHYPTSKNTADLVAYFFLRAFELLTVGGTCGFIATNTISQGDTRETGLDHILKMGATVFFAARTVPWPGLAAVSVSVVHLMKGSYQGQKILDGKPAVAISALLDDALSLGEPKILNANANKSFIGEFLMGIGFVLTPQQADELIEKNARNAKVLSPYLIGDDLTTRPDQSPSRWAINFFDWSLEEATKYEDCMKIVREKVYPQRMKQKDKFGRENWWRYMRSRPDMHDAISGLPRVLVTARVSAHHFMALTHVQQVFSDRLVVIAFADHSIFALLSSTIHDAWAHRPGSTTHETRNTYFPTDAFETFPFPQPLLSDDVTHHAPRTTLDAIGEQYHEHRRQIMLARQEGLTTTYNRFHDSDERSADIARLRALHVEMDRAVAAAYGWEDLALGHGFHETQQGVRFTLSESARREVLSRLLELNHRRYEEEQLADKMTRGQEDKMTKKAGAKGSAKKGKKSGGDEASSAEQIGLW